MTVTSSTKNGRMANRLYSVGFPVPWSVIQTHSDFAAAHSEGVVIPEGSHCVRVHFLGADMNADKLNEHYSNIERVLGLWAVTIYKNQRPGLFQGYDFMPYERELGVMLSLPKDMMRLCRVIRSEVLLKGEVPETSTLTPYCPVVHHVEVMDEYPLREYKVARPWRPATVAVTYWENNELVIEREWFLNEYIS